LKKLVFLVALAACGSDSPKLAVDKLEDPATCMECHPTHHDQWSGSMHAYATDDPVFVAMEKRGQRETNGQLGTFCIQCHAPMAVALGTVTADNAMNFDLSTLPSEQRGITCYFCHNVESIKDDHNNGLVLAMDQTMRGGARNPVNSPAHNSKYDPMMASATNNSQMCGSCHDVTTPKNVALERTYSEWKTTIFAHNDPANLLPLTCSGCHMPSHDDVIADKPGLNVPLRPSGFHEHLWPAIDEALTTWPNPDAMSMGIERDLHGAIAVVGATPTGQSSAAAHGGICVTPLGGGQITVRIDSRGTGHMWPSGAAQDRRAWLELIAYDASNNVVFSSGVVADDKDPEEINDPNLFWMYDRMDKDDGTPAHFFWEAAKVETPSHLIRPPITLVQTDPAFDHSSTATFSVPGATSNIDHITARVRIRPLGLRVLDDLVSSGDLDAGIASHLKTLDISGTQRTWNKATGALGGSNADGCNPNQYN
jgi:hypothetical protein